MMALFDAAAIPPMMSVLRCTGVLGTSDGLLKAVVQTTWCRLTVLGRLPKLALLSSDRASLDTACIGKRPVSVIGLIEAMVVRMAALLRSRQWKQRSRRSHGRTG